MAIDYKSLFSSNFFTRAQVDILIQLANLIIAEGGGEAVSDPLKADKVTIMAAGTGLTGGGDLSQNRTFALDLAFLDARYPILTDGKINVSVLPSLATSGASVVASEAAMLALSVGVGHIAIRTDVSKNFVLSALPATTLGNWLEMFGATGVTSFAGRTGIVTTANNDYTFAQIGSKPTTLSGYGITDAEPAFAAGTTADYRRGDKTWQVLNKAAVGLGNVDNTADNSKPLGTTQLATLAADTGLALIGSKGPGSGTIVRNTDAQLFERGLSLRNYANADGSDETTKIANWLTACKDNKRKGYVPAGSYSINNVSLTGDYFDIECHPEAKFVGLVTETLGSEISPTATSGTWTLSGTTPPTQDGSGIHFSSASNIAAASQSSLSALNDNTVYEVTYTVANYSGGSVRVIVYGDTANHAGVTTDRSANGVFTERVTTGSTGSNTNQIRIQATGSSGTNTYDITAISVKEVIQVTSDPMITLTSATGTTTARIGQVRWVGGQFDVSVRNHLATEGKACGLKLANYARTSVTEAQFIGAADFEVGETTGKAGSGLRLDACDRNNVNNNLFQGFVEGGVLVTGGTNTANNDDAVGTIITNNHFIKCKYGVRATRAHRNVRCGSNQYEQCYVGVAAYEADTALRAARINISGESFRRPGKAAIHVRHQLGFAISNNTILDLGYKLDGTTTVTGTTVAGILTEGCLGGEIFGNVMRMDELTVRTGQYGVANLFYTFNSITEQPTDIYVHDNHIADVQFGFSEAGSSGINNRYRNNDLRSVTTVFDTIPNEFLPYGTYTPTLTNTTNVSASTPAPSMWRRDERDITVHWACDIDPTATGAAEVQISLPIDPGADFGNSYELIGVAYNETHNVGGRVLANLGANRRARLLFAPTADVTSQRWHGTLLYRVPEMATPSAPPGGGTDLATDTGVLIQDNFGVQIQV